MKEQTDERSRLPAELDISLTVTSVLLKCGDAVDIVGEVHVTAAAALSEESTSVSLPPTEKRAKEGQTYDSQWHFILFISPSALWK